MSKIQDIVALVSCHWIVPKTKKQGTFVYPGPKISIGTYFCCYFSLCFYRVKQENELKGKEVLGWASEEHIEKDRGQ